MAFICRGEEPWVFTVGVDLPSSEGTDHADQMNFSWSSSIMLQSSRQKL
jgi:hypothetical protein